MCSGADFYIRKDFDPKVGLTVVIIGALISAGFYWFGRDLIAYSILGAAALIDLVVYGRLKDLTVCYRCHTEFRGALPAHGAPPSTCTPPTCSEQEYERRSDGGDDRGRITITRSSNPSEERHRHDGPSSTML